MQIVAVENHEMPTDNSGVIMKAFLAGLVTGGILGIFAMYKVYTQNTEVSVARARSLEPLATKAKPSSEKTIVNGSIKKVYEITKHYPKSTYVMFDAVLPNQNYKFNDTYKFVCASQEIPIKASALEDLLKEQIGAEISIRIEKEKLKTLESVSLNLIDIIKIGEYDHGNLLKAVIK